MKKIDIFNNKKVLVTGHTGFKGAWLSKWLDLLGAKVIGVSKDVPTSPSHFENLQFKNRISDYRVNINDQIAIEEIVLSEKPDFVFHLAAQSLVKASYDNPIQTWNTNTIGTINVLESLRKLNHKCIAILITSDKCYDNVEWVWGYKESDKLGGPDPYSASKGAAEIAISSYCRSFFPKDGNIKIASGRAGNVIGGGDWAEDRIVPDCIKAWACNKMVPIRNPLSTRPWQHVLEPLSGYINLALELSSNNALSWESFNFGPDSSLTRNVGELVEVMSSFWPDAKWENLSREDKKLYESKLLKLNCDKALFYLNWSPVWDFSQTVSKTMTWYKNYYENPLEITSLTTKQIKSYMTDAYNKGLLWAL
tara:strand:+ start:642 stop:1736 length:1095 start_codon:yes stop_codon:yes gene_type:complete